MTLGSDFEFNKETLHSKLIAYYSIKFLGFHDAPVDVIG